jgi:hypothetical protein
MTEPKYYQFYDLHMKNGKVLSYAEEYDIPAEKGIVGEFKRGKKRFLEYEDLFHGYTIPLDQISFIVATDVQKCI